MYSLSDGQPLTYAGCTLSILRTSGHRSALQSFSTSRKMLAMNVDCGQTIYGYSLNRAQHIHHSINQAFSIGGIDLPHTTYFMALCAISRALNVKYSVANTS
jgi:hypothetical protein